MEKTLEFKKSEIRGITVISSNNIKIAYAIDLNVVRSKEFADFLGKLEERVTFIRKLDALIVIIEYYGRDKQKIV